MNFISDELYHYGVKRRSGRYPYGSGEDPFQHEPGYHQNVNMLKSISDMKGQGMTESEIATALNIGKKHNSTELRNYISAISNANKLVQMKIATKMKNEENLGPTEIGRRMNLPESTVRSLLNEKTQARAQVLGNTADRLREEVGKKKYIDIGEGSEHQLGVSKDKLSKAVAQLESEGYVTANVQVEQAGNAGKYTTIKTLAPPGSDPRDIRDNKHLIKTIVDKTNGDDINTTMTNLGISYPKSLDSKRVLIRYDEEGGTHKDGVIELRRGVEDISLGQSRYSQVRVMVDNAYYLKGMAMYSDNIPKGYDVVFNTNKKIGTPPEKVFKELKKNKDGSIDKDNPFGATIKEKGGQRWYEDKNGEQQLSVINKVNDEGDWVKWKPTLSPQMLSKQSEQLIERQLGLSYDFKKNEFEEIRALTNPTVKRHMLESFADDCDASAVHLKAAAMPRQGSHVILPVESLKETEIYAPKYRDGETVCLIRYPHGGKFEIPELTVNNRNKEAKSVITPDAIDAVGINHKVAERLSGADFDGDTVLVIPNNRAANKSNGMPSIAISNPLEGLKNFDPKAEYALPDSAPRMKSQTKQKEMGVVSNLITDMTLKGAKNEEIARAVRHSMVVIDAEKHHLDYKKSAVDHGIAELKKKYQNGGASTIISRAKGEKRVNERTLRYDIDPETGKKIYRESGKTYTDKNGNVKPMQSKITQMEYVDDAMKLTSDGMGGTKIEYTYAQYANALKSMANTARKESLGLKTTYDKEAAVTYKEEVKSLKAKLNIAKSNSPYERQAQLAADAIVKAKLSDNDEMTKQEIVRMKGQALSAARRRVGAKKETVEITDKEWKAIQAGAVTESTLSDILKNTDSARIKKLATPKTSVAVPPSKLSVAKRMQKTGYTLAEIADRLGVSQSTLQKALKG